jgi:pseudouridine-5'-phosphate glycosidase/pseudouridine kinase
VGLPLSLAEAVNRGAPIELSEEVEDALATGKPVVALETTIVTHGMPYPTSLTTALSVEANVRKSGAIPATIGLLGGRVRIGLDTSQLERLAASRTDSVKVSRRDIGAALALKRDGGTTCSATLVFAALSGIKVVNFPILYKAPL